MKDLTFDVFNSRRGTTITYLISKTDTGWFVNYIAINGECDQEGKPFLYMNFDQDNITYPSDLGSMLEHLWSEIDDEEIGRDEAQRKLQELADWVTLCEKNVPLWEGWNC